MTRVRITVSHSARIGVLNTGTVIGNIEAHLNAIDTGQPEAAALREHLQELAQAIANLDEMDEAQRKEALEGIDFLAEAAADPESMPPQGVLRSVITWLSQIAQVSDSLHTIWTQVGGPVARFFGLG